jgi:hypothetical protein
MGAISVLPTTGFGRLRPAPTGPLTDRKRPSAVLSQSRLCGAKKNYSPVLRRRATPERGPRKYAQLSPRNAAMDTAAKASSDMSDARILSRIVPIQANPIIAKTIPEMRLRTVSKRFKRWLNFENNVTPAIRYS